MKKSISIFAILILFTSCGNNSTETTAITDSTKTDAPENEPIVQKEETLCFFLKSTGLYGEEHIQLTTKGDSVKGTSDETMEWIGENTTLMGMRKADTLFLKSIFRDGPGGDLVTKEKIYLLQANKLFLFETIEKNIKAVLKNPTNPKIILTYDKVNCK